MLSALLSFNSFELLLPSPRACLTLSSRNHYAPCTGNYASHHFWCHFKATNSPAAKAHGLSLQQKGKPRGLPEPRTVLLLLTNLVNSFKDSSWLERNHSDTRLYLYHTLGFFFFLNFCFSFWKAEWSPGWFNPWDFVQTLLFPKPLTCFNVCVQEGLRNGKDHNSAISPPSHTSRFSWKWNWHKYGNNPLSHDGKS